MDEFNRARIASYIILAQYNKLIELSICDLEDNPEFLNGIETLKKYTAIELDEYSKIPNDIVLKYLDTHTVTGDDNSLELRVYFRLCERRTVIHSMRHNIQFFSPTLPSAIASKVAIDIVKDVDETIDKIACEKLDDETDEKVLKMYFMAHKYTLLSSDSFSEKIALENNFNVKKMPRIDLYAVGKKAGVPLVLAAQEVFLDMILSAINSIININGNDMYHNSYISMMEVARVKSLLPYLDKEHLMRINSLLDNDSYRFKKNSAIVKVKKIIDKRKEEFNIN